MKKYVFFLAVILVLFGAVTSHADVEVVVFDDIFVRGTGTPVTVLRNFQAANGPAIVKLTNVSSDDADVEKVSSSVVTVNGINVFDASNFNQNVDYVEETVALNDGLNTLGVVLRSKPNGKIRIQIVQTIQSDTVSGHVKLPPTTKTISGNAELFLISVSGDGSVFVFDKNIEQVLPLVPNDVLVMGITNLTPFGALRKVTSIVTSGDIITLETSQATLENAIENCHIKIKYSISPGGVISATLKEGVTFTHSSPFELTLVDVIIYDLDGDLGTTVDQVRANGGLSFTYDFDFELEIDEWELVSLTFTNTVEEDSALEVTVGDSLQFSEEAQIAEFDLPLLTIWIGFPVIIDPELEVNVGVDGEVNASVTTGVTQEANFTAGLDYNDGVWSPISDLTNGFEYNEPSISAGATVEAYMGPQLNLLLYGLAGPYAKTRGYLELEADPFCDPWWELYGGLAVDVGVIVEVLGETIADYEYPGVIDYRTLLAQASGEDADGLVAYWSFDNLYDPGHDDSGNLHDGTVNGATWSSNGISGGAMSFDGIDDYITLVDLEFPKILTVTAWIKTSLTYVGDIVTSPNSFLFFVHNGTRLSALINGGCQVFSTGSVNDGIWHFAATTYDGNLLKLYVDGVLHDSNHSSGLLETSWDPNIGRRGGQDHGGYFNGTIDEIRIYDRALSEAEIQSLFNSP